MKRKEFIRSVQSSLCLKSKAQAKQVLEVLEGTILEALQAGDTIPLSFGKLYLHHRKPRYFRTPDHQIHASKTLKTLKFKPKPSLLSELNPHQL